MWLFRSPLEKRRLQVLKHCLPGPLLDFYSQAFPDDKAMIQDLSFIALDLELTGLDSQNDHIISIGLVEINHMGIQLGTHWHQIIHTHKAIPESTVIIHQLTDDQVSAGLEIEKALPLLLQRLKGKVLIAHHALIESGFISKLCHQYYNEAFFMPTIDTMQLGRRQLERQHEHLAANALRLYNLRKYYRLPAYKAHNALYDALSTAELFLALVYDLYPKLDCTLNDLVFQDK